MTRDPARKLFRCLHITGGYLQPTSRGLRLLHGRQHCEHNTDTTTATVLVDRDTAILRTLKIPIGWGASRFREAFGLPCN